MPVRLDRPAKPWSAARCRRYPARAQQLFPEGRLRQACGLYVCALRAAGVCSFLRGDSLTFPSYAGIDVGPDGFRLLRRGLGVVRHEGIYTPRVVIWMMMLQRLDGRGTLASTVDQLVLGQFDSLLSQCKRVRERKIAPSTGGYCQARQNLPKMLLDRSVDEILQRLRNHLKRMPLLERPVNVLDGSGLQLDNCPELKQAYPPARNPRRPSHWPVLRVVVLHDVETGLAQQPAWGTMYGPQAVSEQLLAQQALDAPPPGAALIGDRNFGIFAPARSAHQKGHQVVIRMTSQRAKRLLGAAIDRQGDYPVEWKASPLEHANMQNGPPMPSPGG